MPAFLVAILLVLLLACFEESLWRFCTRQWTYWSIILGVRRIPLCMQPISASFQDCIVFVFFCEYLVELFHLLGYYIIATSQGTSHVISSVPGALFFFICLIVTSISWCMIWGSSEVSSIRFSSREFLGTSSLFDVIALYLHNFWILIFFWLSLSISFGSLPVSIICRTCSSLLFLFLSSFLSCCLTISAYSTFSFAFVFLTSFRFECTWSISMSSVAFCVVV